MTHSAPKRKRAEAKVTRTSGVARWSCFCLLLGCLLAAPAIRAQTAVPEYEVKAAFLYNFIKFVQWPKQKEPTNKDPFIVGVLGQDPFQDKLEKIFGNKTIGEHPIL